MEGTENQNPEETETPETPEDPEPEAPVVTPETPEDPEPEVPEVTPGTTVTPEPEVTPEEVVVPEETADEAETDDGIMLLDDVMPLADEGVVNVTSKASVDGKATVTFTNDCLTSDNKTQANTAITFEVTLADGYALADAGVTSKVGTGEAAKLTPEGDGSYKIANATGSALTGDVEIVVNVEPIKASYKIEGETTTDKTGVAIAAEAGANEIVKDTATAIDPTKPISFKVTGVDGDTGLAVDSVQYKVGADGTAKDADVTDGVYSISLADVHDAIVITVTVKDVEYTVNAPAANTTFGVTWQVKETTSGSLDATATLKKGQGLTATATLADTSAYDVSIAKKSGGDPVVLNSENKTGDVTFTFADITGLTPKTDGSYDISSLLNVTGTKVQVPVSVVAAEGTTAGSYTVEWGYEVDEKVASYKTLSGSSFGPDKNQKVSLRVKAKSGYVVKSVTKKTGSITVTTKTDDDGATVAVFTAVPTDDEAGNAVEITTESVSHVLNVKLATDAQVDKVQYTAGGGSATAAVKTAAGWEVRSKDSAVKLVVTPKANNEVTYIHDDSKTHTIKEDGSCDGCVAFTPATGGPVTFTEAVDMSGDDFVNKSYTVYTKKVTVPYKLVADEASFGEADAKKVVFTVEDPDGNPVAKVTADGPTKDTYVLDDGKDYRIKISGVELEELAEVKSDKTGAEALKYNGNLGAFVLTAAKADLGSNDFSTITVKKVAKEGVDVAFAMKDNSNTGDQIAKISIGKYQKYAAGSVTETTATDSAAIAAGTKAEAVLVGSGLSFTLAPQSVYRIKSVTAALTADSTTSVPVTVNGSTYTIAKVTAGTTVTVETELDPDKAHKITVEGDENVTFETDPTVTSGSDFTFTADKKTIYVVTGAAETVTVSYTVATGYMTDQVTKDGVALETTPSGSFAVAFTAEQTKQTVNYKITTKEEAAVQTDDKFVKIKAGDGVEVKVTEPANIQQVSSNAEGVVYKLTGDVMEEDGTTVKTPGIHELRFDVLVSYGKKLADESWVTGAVRKTAETRVKSGDSESWVYSYKVVGSQLTATTAETADAVNVADAADEDITISKKSGSKDFKIKGSDKQYDTFASKTAKHGETISLQIAAGQTLEVNGEAVNVDDEYIYSFTAELDETKAVDATVYEINVKDASAYQLKYVKKAKGEAAPADDVANYTETLDENVAIETDYEDTVYVWLKDAEGNNAAIVDKEVVEEGSKSTLTIAEGSEHKASIVMKDASYTVKFYTLKTGTTGGISTEEKVLAATIKLVSNNAAGKNLTISGIKDKGTVKLDAMSVATYPLTLKEGKKELNAADYKLAVSPSTDAEEAKAVAVAEIVEGKLVIKTLKANEAEEFKITAPGVTDPLMTFTVQGQTPALKLKSMDSIAQGMNDVMLTLTPDAAIGEVNSEFKLYYEVTVAKSPKNKGTSETDKLGTYYVEATALEDGKKVAAAATQIFKVNDDSGEKAVANTYTFSARLVAVDKNTTPTVGSPEAGTVGTLLTGDSIKFASAASIAKDFTTRTDYYEDKLGVTKKNAKLFSGQQNVVVAVPKFSNNAGRITIVDAEVLDRKDGTVASGVTATYDSATMEVKVSAAANSAGNYDVVIRAIADLGSADKRYDGFEMYRATAKVPITVQRGIQSIEVTGVPSQIAMIADKKGNKKDVTITAKPTGWYGYVNGKQMKGQSQKFEYEFADLEGTKNAGMVTVKGNKITISKNFVLSNDPDKNTFKVRVKAKDYADSTVFSPWMSVMVTNKTLEIGKVQLVDGSGKALPATVDTLTLKAGARLAVTDTYGNDISEAVTVTPAKGKIFAKKNNLGKWITQYEGYTKTVTFKAVTTDGGKKSLSSIKYTVNYPAVAKYGIYVGTNNKSLDTGALLDWTSETDCSYKGLGNDLVDFTVVAYDKNGGYQNAPVKDFNYTVKVAGGKNLTNKASVANGYYNILPSADTVKITVTDKTTKKAYVFTLKNTNWQKTGAPSASTKNKLYNVYYPTTVPTVHDAEDPIPQDLTYTLKKADGYTHVKLTNLAGSYGYTSINTVTVPLDGASFKLEGVTADGVGTDKIAAVYGVMEEGRFAPKTKAATLTIKVNKVSTPKATKKYNINPNESWGVKLSAKPVLKNSDQGNEMIVYEAVLAGNNKGKMNRFTEFFTVENGLLQIRSDVRNNQEKMAELLSLANDKEGKKNLIGYLVYKYDIGPGPVEKTEQITVTLNEKAKGSKYTADSVNIVGAANAEATTTVKLDGTAVALAQVVSGTEGWTASFGTTEDKAAGKVILRATTAPKSGNVDIYIIPQGSRNENEANPDKIKELGIKVSVKVTAQAEDATASKLTVTKKAKKPTAAIAGNKVQLTVAFTKANKDFDYVLSNAQIAANGVAKADAADETVISATYTADNEGTITIVLDRDKINPKNADTVVNVPVKVTFTAGAAETVTFPVQLTKALTRDSIKAQIESKLNNLPVGEAAYADGSAAAAAVNSALSELKEDMDLDLAGVTVGTGAAAADFATTHKIQIAVTDVTLTEAAAVNAEVTVSKAEPPAAAPADAQAAIKIAFEKYALPTVDGTVESGKTVITKNLTNYQVKAMLKAEVDKYWAGKYIIDVDPIEAGDFTETTKYDADGGEIKLISQLVVSYMVSDVTDSSSAGTTKTATITESGVTISQ